MLFTAIQCQLSSKQADTFVFYKIDYEETSKSYSKYERTYYEVTNNNAKIIMKYYILQYTSNIKKYYKYLHSIAKK